MKTTTSYLKLFVISFFYVILFASTSGIYATEVTFTAWATGSLHLSAEYTGIADKSVVTKITVIPANGTTKVNPTDITNIKNDFVNLTTLDLSGVQYSALTFGQIFGNGAANTTFDTNTVKLQSISLPSNVTATAAACFKNCPELTTVVLPASIATLNWFSFYNCSKLSTINLHETAVNSTNTTGASIFAACTSLKEIILPDALTTIPNAMFNGCTALETVTLPTTSAITINLNAFLGCTGITKIISKSTTVPAIAGDGPLLPTIPVYAACKVYVPSASVSAYQNSEDATWAKFNDTNFLPMENLTTNMQILSKPISIVSNPVKTNFSITNVDNIEQVQLISITGQIIKTYDASSNTYSVGNLSNGNYLVRVFANGESQVCKITVRN